MRSHPHLIVLGLFVALGMGLAMCIALSEPSTANDFSSGSSNRDEPFPHSTSAWQCPPEGPTLPGLPELPGSANEPPGNTSSAIERAFRADRQSPVHVMPNPPLADNQDRAVQDDAPAESNAPATNSDPASPRPWLVEKLYEASKSAIGSSKTEAASESQSVTAQKAIPTSEISQSATNTNRNSIRRTNDATGDQFVINIQDEDIRNVLDLLSRDGRMNILASPNVQGKVSATLNVTSLESALNAILKSTGFQSRRDGQYIFVGTPDDLIQMARISDQITTRIYHPDYVTSAELEKLIKPVLTEGVGIISLTSEAGSGIASNTGDTGGDSYAGSDALLVRDYEAVLQEVDELVAQVDVQPLQVHIEAMLLSVKLDDENKMGVNFQLLRQFEHLKFGWGNIPDKISDVKLNGGLKVAYLDQTLGTFIEALEKIGDTNIIATPRLMVVNKHAAEIQIGKSEGYVNTTQTETANTQTVEFLELGTLLRIRPFISSDGMIRMEVHPEISDGSVRVEDSLTIPRKEVTQVTTNIMVRDGCTAVIGGLIQDEKKDNHTQIPLLGSMPVIGVMFREKTETLKRHELIVLITPSIVRERQTYREAAIEGCEFQRRQMAFTEKMMPIGKRSLGRKYMRRARAAWSTGNRRQALRLAELAVHFDPNNREAIELRSDIWLGKPFEADTPPEGGTLPPGMALDGPQIAPWVLNQLGRPNPQGDPRAMGPQSVPVPVESIPQGEVVLPTETSDANILSTPLDELPASSTTTTQTK